MQNRNIIASAAIMAAGLSGATAQTIQEVSLFKSVDGSSSDVFPRNGLTKTIVASPDGNGMAAQISGDPTRFADVRIPDFQGGSTIRLPEEAIGEEFTASIEVFIPENSNLAGLGLNVRFQADADGSGGITTPEFNTRVEGTLATADVSQTGSFQTLTVTGTVPEVDNAENGGNPITDFEFNLFVTQAGAEQNADTSTVDFTIRNVCFNAQGSVFDLTKQFQSVDGDSPAINVRSGGQGDAVTAPALSGSVENIGDTGLRGLRVTGDAGRFADLRIPGSVFQLPRGAAGRPFRYTADVFLPTGSAAFNGNLVLGGRFYSDLDDSGTLNGTEFARRVDIPAQTVNPNVTGSFQTVVIEGIVPEFAPRPEGQDESVERDPIETYELNLFINEPTIEGAQQNSGPGNIDFAIRNICFETFETPVEMTDIFKDDDADLAGIEGDPESPRIVVRGSNETSPLTGTIVTDPIDDGSQSASGNVLQITGDPDGFDDLRIFNANSPIPLPAGFAGQPFTITFDVLVETPSNLVSIAPGARFYSTADDRAFFDGVFQSRVDFGGSGPVLTNNTSYQTVTISGRIPELDNGFAGNDNISARDPQPVDSFELNLFITDDADRNDDVEVTSDISVFIRNICFSAETPEGLVDGGNTDLVATIARQGDDIVLSWNGVAGETYTIEASPNLAAGSFSPIETEESELSVTLEDEVTSDPTRRFFRVRGPVAAGGSEDTDSDQ